MTGVFRLDCVVSDTEDVHFSYLIRSALVNDKRAIGSHKVLEAIMKYSQQVGQWWPI